MESSNEKAAITVQSDENLTGKDDYTLVELSPEKTLVRFSPDSAADPNRWMLVSYIVYTLHINRVPYTNNYLYRVRKYTTQSWGCSSY